MRAPDRSPVDADLAEDFSYHEEAWEKSYANRDNFTFYPSEEVIRFVSRYIRKRTGLSEFRDIHSLDHAPRLLDLGCGIGSHVLFAYQTGLEVYGVDLSQTALAVATERAAQVGLPPDRLQQADIQHLPWPDGFFDYVISRAVLDSMHFEIARVAVSEVARLLSAHGLFYCDLISADDRHPSDFSGEEIVTGTLETGTVQSYFDVPKIQRLIEGHFVIRDASLITKTNLRTSGGDARYHIVLEKAVR
jgi:SAM-dependent methyltransferase